MVRSALRKMKILLIYPYCLEDRLHTEDVGVVPIGVYYIGALLKENHYDVEILNWHNIKNSPQKIAETLRDKKPDIIGISILHANRWGGLDIARVAKKADPDVKIIFGGVGATFLWKHFLTHFKEVDFVVIGEGEYSFLNLVRCVEKADYGNIDTIRGIAFRKDGRAVRTGEAAVIQDLDKLPIPAKYFEYRHVSSTRGCPGRCTFCGSPQFWGNKVRFHSTEYFVKQLELLYGKGITSFCFSDDTFTINKDRVIEICKKILDRDLKVTWVAISQVKYVSEEMLYWMRRAGCIQISFGVESGSEAVRRGLNKNITTDQIKKAFALTTKYGILARAYFIYGASGETWSTIRETIDLIHQIKPLSIIFYLLDIFPGTALYSDLKKRSGITDDVWLEKIEDILYFETDSRLSQEQILDFGETLRREYHESLAGFAGSIELIDQPELYETHADFLSRLAMTFTHGDYAGIEAIRGKVEAAERLYRKSLGYHPSHRAYLGLGIIQQKKGDYKESIRTLSEGTTVFPKSEPLNMCLGISYMNLGQYDSALSCFLAFQGSKAALSHIADCYKAMGDSENASAFLKKRRSLEKGPH
jgi:anaerobic magnesium-protoporphyrin IX monomethyl ester cyclase